MVFAFSAIEAGEGHWAGRALLEKLYVQQTGSAPPQILRLEGGKPYFKDSPWHFSISHTKKHAFCVLSDRPIGIDAEEADRDIDLRLAEKILSPKEKARWEDAPDKRAALLKLWVLKEADAKCSGKGIIGYPNKTDFSPDDPRIREIAGCYVAIIQQLL